MLWSLLRASKASLYCDPVFNAGELTETTIILEPIGGGGDLVVQSREKTTVEQLKARPNGDTWSLREVVESVIPDLYLAANNLGDVDFRFVTEGRMGKWNDVYKFFRSLRLRSCPDNPLDDLDNTVTLKFARRNPTDGKRTPFWDLDGYTQRTLFEKIVKVVRQRARVCDVDDELTTKKKLRKVLTNFEFVGGQEQSVVKQQIDSHLLTIVDRNDDLSRIRDNLCLELMRRATYGGAQIHCDNFFEEHGLSAIPLSNISLLRKSAQRLAADTVGRLGYETAADVRRTTVETDIRNWPVHIPALVITGESGYGKSWRAFGICDLEQASPRLSVFVPGGSTTDDTLNRASIAIWQETAGHDQTIPLSRVSERLRQSLPQISIPWLTLVLDGVDDVRQAEELINQDWERWGIRLVMTAKPDVARVLEERTRGRCQVIDVPDFTDVELHSYLQNAIGDTWPVMPEFVRSPLRIPLLASIYTRVLAQTSETAWDPSTEYQLFDRFTQLILDPLASSGMVQLGGDFLENGRPTWSVSRVRQICDSAEVALQLENCGWFRRANSGLPVEYEFSHMRLLNWACALSLLSTYKVANAVKRAHLHEELRALLWGEQPEPRGSLGFVCMDFLWLMCNDTSARSDAANVIDELTREGYRQQEVFFDELAPTLGSAAIAPLAELLKTHIGDSMATNWIANAIGQIGGEDCESTAHAFLDSTNPLLQLAAANILSKSPSASALDSLWTLHIRSIANPAIFLRKGEEKLGHLLYSQTFSALQECIKLQPDWIGQTIQTVNSNMESVCDLAYLMLSIKGGVGKSLWQNHKTVLFEHVPSEKCRCLAMCIDAFSDTTELDWLVEHTADTEELIGAASLRALGRLDPSRAVESLDRIESKFFIYAHSWFSDELFVRRLDATQRKIHSIMEKSNDPWRIARIYDGRVNFMYGATLNLLLASLESMLEATLSGPDPMSDNGLFGPLRLLVQANTVAQLERLASYVGTNLESRLADYVLRLGPRSSSGRDSATREDAIALLHRINGQGFAIAVNSLLRAESHFGQGDGLTVAPMKPNAETLELLTDICLRKEARDGHYIDQCNSAAILAEAGRWEPVIDLIRRIGLQTLTVVSDMPRNSYRCEDRQLRSVIETARANPTQLNPGDIMALGFGKAENGTLLAEIAKVFPCESEEALACVVALAILGDQSPDNVPLLRRQLEQKDRWRPAANALIRNGSTEALAALSDDAGATLMGAVAINLLTRGENSTNAIERTRSSIVDLIRSGNVWELSNKIDFICSNLHDESIVERLLDDTLITDFLRQEAFADEGNSWVKGSKPSAIRCLSKSDPHSAFVAAKAAFRNQNSHDRDFYPALLVEIDERNGWDLLFVSLMEEPDHSIRTAMGRALGRLDTSYLQGAFKGRCAVRKQSACYVRKWSDSTDDLVAALTDCLDDSDEKVSREAVASLIALSAQNEAGLVVQSLVNAADNSVRWLMLNCLLELADPGDRHHRWPMHGPDIWYTLTPLQRSHARRRLKKRREDEATRLKRMK